MRAALRYPFFLFLLPFYSNNEGLKGLAQGTAVILFHNLGIYSCVLWVIRRDILLKLKEMCKITNQTMGLPGLIKKIYLHLPWPVMHQFTFLHERTEEKISSEPLPLVRACKVCATAYTYCKAQRVINLSIYYLKD